MSSATLSITESSWRPHAAACSPPWAPDDGYWCTRVTITIGGSDIQLLGGEADAGQILAPSANNIAVLFAPARLPEWEQYDDGA